MSDSSAKPRLPWTLRLTIALFSAITEASRRADGTINRRLLSFVDLRAAPNPIPQRGVHTLDLTVDPNRNLWIRLFLPTADSRRHHLPLVVFFHGGGFAYLSADNRSYDLLCRRLACKIPAVIVSVNYRLSPEHRFPAPYEDGADVLHFIDSGGIDKAAGHLSDPSFCFLAGDSAGANIVHHVARRWAAAASVGGFKKLKLLGIVQIQPFYGGEERTESEIRLTGAPIISTKGTDWLWRAFLPAGEDRDHEAVNVLGPKDRTEIEEKFPPAMVVVGGFDPLKDWQRLYCERLRARGKEVTVLEFPEAIHSFYIFPGIAESGKLVEEMGKFVWSKCEQVVTAAKEMSGAEQEVVLTHAR
ncbi:probable carboxylesterase 18 [Dendrobium catenatum]|uniref:Putative carboxylesterase 18 n=1 Tax=Dendrobium catenatum TaxID=906689 RepID=A0A2I0VMW3_9ASPA|nr:probable carboxylesterase 18 [Dendrobium catenatum]PKU64752.1 putative carboxylesterase 18 [Dendrobium catenatum]